MPRRINDERKVYIFPEEAPEVYVEYTIRNEKSSGADGGKKQVRLMCTLFEKNKLLCTTSFVAEEGSNYNQYVQENARKLFKRAIQQHPCCEHLYKKIYYGMTPFQKYLKNHFEHIAILNDWAASTTLKYRGTLMNQLAPQLPAVPLRQLTAENFDKAIDALIQQRKEDKNGEGYSESRIEQFFSVLHSVMEYAAYMVGMENVLKDSKYYNNKNRKRAAGKSTETLIRKWLRPKALNLQELKGAAACILAELENGNPLAIGTAIQLWLPLRPSEVCGLRFENIFHFTQPGWQDRCYFLVHLGVTTDRKYNARLKTENAYRAVPIPRELQILLERYKKARMEEGGLTEEQVNAQPILLKNGNLVKSSELCVVSKKILSNIMKVGSGLSDALLRMEDEDGEERDGEENTTAYQYRRNGASMYLNICGLPVEDVQSILGHDIRAVDGKRWLLNHEEALIRKMQLMDRLILFPDSSESMEKELSRHDPRLEVYEVDGCGSFRDTSTLHLEVQPYSETDVVTIQMELKAREPHDALRCSVDAGVIEQSQAIVFLEEKADPHSAVNLENVYLDALFDTGP